MAGSIMDSKSPLHHQQDSAQSTNPSNSNNNSNQPATSSDNVAAYRDLLEASAKAMAKQHSSPQQRTSRPSSSRSATSSRDHKKDDENDEENSPPAYISDLASDPQSSMPAEANASAYSPHSERSSAGSTHGGSQQFCLRWNNYQSNLTSVFDQLLQSEAFVDVTLACDGRSIKAHKMVLSACSPYFQTLFSTTPCQHPIVIMRDVNWRELKAIVDFMYKGEINVSQDQIGPLLRIAEMLKVRGLADVGNITGSSETAQLSTKLERNTSPDKEYYSPPPPQHVSGVSSPKMPKKSSSPYRKRSPSGCQRSDSQMDLLTTAQMEKTRLPWDLNLTGSRETSTTPGRTPATGGLELRLSPLPHSQHTAIMGRNIRKRRWPSADTIFNPPESPLGSLIAAERAEQERNRERERERVRERGDSLFTPPMPVMSGSSSSANVLEPITHLDFPSPSPTPTPSQLVGERRTPGSLLSSTSPRLQISHQSQQQQQQQQQQHQQQTHQPSTLHSQHSSGHGAVGSGGGVGGGGGHQRHDSGLQSHRSSPASSVTSTHPSSILSRPLTPSPASISGSAGVSGSDRFAMGPAQAAAMLGAAAASQMELNASAASMGMRSMSSSGPSMAQGPSHHVQSIADDLEIKPGIAEMIREEERAKMMENSHAWMGGSGSSLTDSYQYQLQSMWQKCWNTNQNLMHHLRFRERGPLKSWRPETMAEAIFSVLKEGLSLSQAARKYDIPYPTFVLYANRVHNMLGPSIDGGPDLRPKGRGRPQRILLGLWPDEHIKGVIKTVVFREGKDLKDESIAAHMPPYGRHSPIFPFQQETNLPYPGVSAQCPNGIPTPTPTGDQMSQEATAAAVAAVAHNIRQQMQMAAVQHQQQQQQQHQHQSQQHQGHGDMATGQGMFNLPPHLASSGAMPVPPGPGGMLLPKTSISPALSSASGPGVVGPMMGPRHAPSPCGPGLPVISQLPPGVAAALHMAGSPASRCDPSALLSHMHQQQHKHHQQPSHHQQQLHSVQHQLAYGQHHLPSLSHPSNTSTMIGPPSHSHLQASSTATTTASSTKSSSSTVSPLRRSSPSHSVSPLTELGLEMAFKPQRPFSPSRLFADDIADIVGAAAAAAAAAATNIPSSSSTACTTTATVTTATITASSSSYGLSTVSSVGPMDSSSALNSLVVSSASETSISPMASSSMTTTTTMMAPATAVSASAISSSSSNISSTGIKLEPITTSSD
ncbi:bric a brac 1 [Haematobia irritans]|uniref:bric a brac 1 n=1 Tax=Haematobia irritans TaxID=7368 RepID=UPI003F50215E